VPNATTQANFESYGIRVTDDDFFFVEEVPTALWLADAIPLMSSPQLADGWKPQTRLLDIVAAIMMLHSYKDDVNVLLSDVIITSLRGRPLRDWPLIVRSTLPEPTLNRLIERFGDITPRWLMSVSSSDEISHDLDVSVIPQEESGVDVVGVAESESGASRCTFLIRLICCFPDYCDGN
jgi:hypothetical protein